MTKTLTEIPNLPAPDGTTWLGNWHTHGAGTLRHFTVAKVALPLSGFTYMTALTVGGEQFADGEIVSYVEIPGDIHGLVAADSAVVDHLANSDASLLSPAETLDLADALEHELHTDEPCCNACRDEVWIAATAFRLAAGYLLGFREANGMTPRDEELT